MVHYDGEAPLGNRSWNGREQLSSFLVSLKHSKTSIRDFSGPLPWIMGGDTDPNMVHDAIVFSGSSQIWVQEEKVQTATAMLGASSFKGLRCFLSLSSAKMSPKRLIWKCALTEKVAVVTGSTKG